MISIKTTRSPFIFRYAGKIDIMRDDLLISIKSTQVVVDRIVLNQLDTNISTLCVDKFFADEIEYIIGGDMR